MINLRAIGATIIANVLSGESLNIAIPKVNTAHHVQSKRDRAFIQMLSFGVCRYYPQLEFVLNQLLNKPLAKQEYQVHALLLVGLYQLMHMRVPTYAAISETVNATAALKKPWARKLVNAVLREYIRQAKKLREQINTHEVALYAHPKWLIAAIKKAWPKHWVAILNANNAQPSFSLRVNLLQTTREAYLRLSDGEAIAFTQEGIQLHTPITIEDLPGFMDGLVSVQDGGAQLAADLLMLAPGQSVLDACSAPGGKLTHILEREPKLAYCLAVDASAERMQRVKENLTRLKLHADCVVSDACDTDHYASGKLFDRILCDAPCSATGVIRRHPDIKILRRASDIKTNVLQQLQLLHALWPLLKVDGILLYATCSILPAENTAVVLDFMRKTPDAIEVSIDRYAQFGERCEIGIQILPNLPAQFDGFYYARLRKRSMQ